MTKNAALLLDFASQNPELFTTDQMKRLMDCLSGNHQSSPVITRYQQNYRRLECSLCGEGLTDWIIDSVSNN